MEKNDKILFIFTESYPYGHCDDFIHHEIPYHTANFSSIYVFPLFEIKDQRPNFDLPKGSQLADFNVYEPYKTLPALLINIPLILRLFFAELFRSNSRGNNAKYFISNWRQVLNNVVLARRLKAFIRSKDLENKDLVFYSYWFNRWVFSLAIVKLWHRGSKLFTRAHGSDLYLHKVYNREFFPLRSFQLSQIDNAYCISSDGLSYLKEGFPTYSGKMNLSRLGVKGAHLATQQERAPLYLVSCAHLTDLKRIHLIPSILKHLDFDFKWVHFGDGPEMSNVAKAIKENGLSEKCMMAGHTTHEQVLDFYSKNKVFALLNVSETEGIPVSIMEAISFGIPTVATNVGGNKEIVTPESGFLIDENFDPALIAAHLNEIQRKNTWNETFREGVRAFWSEHYDLEKNYRVFSQELAQ